MVPWSGLGRFSPRARSAPRLRSLLAWEAGFSSRSGSARVRSSGARKAGWASSRRSLRSPAKSVSSCPGSIASTSVCRGGREPSIPFRGFPVGSATPSATAIGAFAFADAWRAVAVVDYRGALTTFDAGNTWRTVPLDGQLMQVSVQEWQLSFRHARQARPARNKWRARSRRTTVASRTAGSRLDLRVSGQPTVARFARPSRVRWPVRGFAGRADCGVRARRHALPRRSSASG